MRMNYLRVVAVVGILVTTNVAPESFVVKKVKQVVVPVKDQCLEQISTCIEQSGNFIGTIGSCLQEYGTVQQDLMKIVKEELEHGEHKLFKLPDAQIKKIQETSQQLHKKVTQVEKMVTQLQNELRDYHTLLNSALPK